MPLPKKTQQKNSESTYALTFPDLERETLQYLLSEDN